MEQLPPGAKEIFVLHDVEGYKHREIAVMRKCELEIDAIARSRIGDAVETHPGKRDVACNAA